MREIWDDNQKYLRWRGVWVASAEALMELGILGTQEQIDELRAYRSIIDYDKVAVYERQTKHDVLAHRKAYADLCPNGGKILHAGLTSDNVTSPAESMQMRDALHLLVLEAARTVDLLGMQAERYRDLPCVGYTHFQEAQPTTIGKRIALWGQGFSDALHDLEKRLELRWGGMRGATGTQEALLHLFNGDVKKIEEYERRVAEKLGLGETYILTGQTPPRSGDYQILSALAEIGMAGQKFGTDIRLLWNTKQVGEPFEEGQLGSSAMAYKQNPSRSERICGLARNLYAYAEAAAHMAGQQWLERTLDDSSQRRIINPDAFLTADAVLNLAMYVAKGLRVYPARVKRELIEHLPFVATENIITSAVRSGRDRTTVYDAVQRHSRSVMEHLMEDPYAQNDLLERIARDPDVGLAKEQIDGIVGDGRHYAGLAPQQVDKFLREVVQPVREKYPEALVIEPEVEI
ncbi:MAG: adenylosuccinate lyase [Candidatus Aenigmarchaeota archaeon]|nr:adenylosuccinate lyase [Candidatus Aenigmarchaeota archaeon]